MDKHDDFFGHIISMIPHELYRGVEESDVSNEKYYKHKKQALTLAEKKKITKEKLKKVYGSFAGEKDEEINDKVEDEVNDEDKRLKKISNDVKNKRNNVKNENVAREEVTSMTSSKNETEIIHENVITTSNSMEELRKRLQDRILGLKQNRMSKNGNINTNQLKRKDRESTNTNNSNNHKKKKPDLLKNDNVNDIATDLLISSTDSSTKKRKDRDVQNENNNQNIESNVTVDIEMNNIKNDSNTINSSDGKPGTKMKRLKRMLDEANRKRERIESLKQSVDEHDNKRASEAIWNDVIKNAAGENSNSFNIDTKKIKKAIKRREKSKEKSAIEWNERKSNLDSQKQLKLEKREENLKIKQNRGNMEKDNSHSDAKTNKLRPGFEGKSANSFLNKNKTDKKVEKSVKK